MALGQLSESVMGAFQFLGKPVVSVSNIRYISGSLWVIFCEVANAEKFKIKENPGLQKSCNKKIIERYFEITDET